MAQSALFLIWVEMVFWSTQTVPPALFLEQTHGTTVTFWTQPRYGWV